MNKWLLGGITLAGVFLFIKTNKAKAMVVPPNNYIVESGKISSPYLNYRGLRKDGSEIIHQGIDIKAPKGSIIRAVSSGIVEKIWLDGEVHGYGNTVLVYNKDGTSALYAHLNHFGNIYEGMPIYKKEVVGYVGQTQKPRPEMKTAPHLHLEILEIHTRNINPTYPKRLSPTEYIRKQNMKVGG